MDFLTRRTLYKTSTLNFLAKQSNLYLLTKIPGNIGDHLIWAGTEDLLRSGRISYASIALKDLENTDLPQGTLLVPGSGALTKSYHEWLPATVTKASRRFSKVIILPSSYDSSVPVVAECLSQPNVFAFARETRSYRLAKVFGRAALSYDCAVYFRGFSDARVSAEDSGEDTRVLVALRGDKDSLLLSKGLTPSPAVNQDISLAKANLKEWITVISEYSSVVTDRLHVAVAAVLFGKRLIYLDPYNLKISNYFDFTFRDAFSDRIQHCYPEWLVANKFVVKRGAE